MKLLLLTDELYPYHLGGAGVVAQQIYGDLQRQNIECYVFCSNPKVKWLKNLYSLIWPFFYIPVLVHILFKNYDLIVVNDLRSAYILGLANSKKIMRKSVYIVHGTEVDIVYNDCTRKNKFIGMRFFYSRFVKACKKIVFVSHFVKDRTINSFHNEKIDTAKAIVSYAGLSYDFITVAKKTFTSLNHEITTNSDITKLVSFSRIEKRKGYEDMVKIYLEALKLNPLISWDVYGEGSFKSELVKIVNSLGLDKTINFHPKLDRLSMVEVINFNKYDAFWLLPNEPEAFGLTFIESSALGVPVIGPSRYGIIEAITVGKNGFYFSNVETLLSDLKTIKECKGKFAISASEYAYLFNSEKFVTDLIN
ncbi:glycosyltransferase family 4 protein [Erwinia sp. LJJL01]|uniref:glycosyltransferase family 4 protein n=1 Tax=Erwinia sp. LJJL01 TaxID=3391839 RepID=UPI00105CA467